MNDMEIANNPAPIFARAVSAIPLGRSVVSDAERPRALEAWNAAAKRVSIGAESACDLELLALGALTPLTQFMGRADYFSTVHTMHLSSGALFPLPIVLPVEPPSHTGMQTGQRWAVSGPCGLKAWVNITEVFERDLEDEARYVFGTTDQRHPGVARLMHSSPWCAAGAVELLTRAESPFPEPSDPLMVRTRILERGWQRVAAFQTRNPIHRAHEHLHKIALEQCDGLLLHPLVGPTKEDDVPAAVRMQAYRVLLERYYPPSRVLLATFPFAMRYAGPREAVFHALVRRNYGATHFIVGRDHAGVGKYYHPRAAQELVLQFRRELGIIPLTFEQIGYCQVCEGMASARSCPHAVSDWITLSGTQVREMLRRGAVPPREFTRPEVAAVLMRAYDAPTR